jgi:hypothetical protein
MSYSDLLLGDWRNVNAGPFLNESLTQVEEIVISSPDFEGAELVGAGDKIGIEALGGVGLRVGDLHFHSLLLVI